MFEFKEIDELVGKTIDDITGLEEGSSAVHFYTNDGIYMLYHEQDCCEHVRLIDFEDGLLEHGGAVVVSAEIVSGYNKPHDIDYYDESHTWTFYKIQTTKGELWLRWLGESNGYYSEGVDFAKVGENYVQ